MDPFGKGNNSYNHHSDMNLKINNNLNMSTTSNNPFNDPNMGFSSHSPFEPFIWRNEKGEVYEEDIQVVSQDPKVDSFVDELILHDP